MAKGKGKVSAPTPVSGAGEPTVVGIEPDGFCSAKVYLSNDATMIVLTAADGGSLANNQANRDTLVAAMQRTLQAAAIPKAGS